MSGHDDEDYIYSEFGEGSFGEEIEDSTDGDDAYEAAFQENKAPRKRPEFTPFNSNDERYKRRLDDYLLEEEE